MMKRERRSPRSDGRIWFPTPSKSGVLFLKPIRKLSLKPQLLWRFSSNATPLTQNGGFKPSGSGIATGSVWTKSSPASTKAAAVRPRMRCGNWRRPSSSNGSLPKATDIVGLTDILHPKYMSDLVREDGWGNPIIYAVTGPSAFRLVSHGADALPGTRDDIVVSSGSTAGQ